jgi:hypothetical protein
MKKLIIIFLIVQFKCFAQPGPALMQPSGFIKDGTDRTVTMKNGEMTNKPVTSYWQLHGSGFQSTVSLGAGGYKYETLIDGGGVGGADLGLFAVTMTGAGTSASMMAPIDLPHNSEMTAFEACYWDRSGQSPNFSNCDLKFTFYRIIDNSCPPEVLGVISSQPSGNQDVNCPIRCTAITLPPAAANLVVSNRDYFYYVIVSSTDSNGGGQMCGNWAAANLGIRGIQIEFKQK